MSTVVDCFSLGLVNWRCTICKMSIVVDLIIHDEINLFGISSLKIFTIVDRYLYASLSVIVYQ